MNRSAMRENAFKLVYSLEIQQEENLEEQIDLFFESNSITDEETKKYIKDVILGIKKEENFRQAFLRRTKFKIRLEAKQNF